MTQRTVDTSPRLYARIAGFLYLLIIVAGTFGELVVRARLVVVGDASATAHNIVSHRLLFRAGIAGDLFMHLCDIPVTVILYYLLRPVNRDLSLMAAWFSMVQTAVLVANKIVLLAGLAFLGGSRTLGSFSREQLQDLGLFAVTLHDDGFAVGLVFFGVACLVTGYLIDRSGFLPRVIGWGQGIAGACYLVNSFALILAPPLAAKLVPAILQPAFLAELATALWLLFKGVNVARWELRPEPGAA